MCVEAEQSVLEAIDRERYDVEVVHLGTDKTRLGEAEGKGVESVPALALGEQVFHINFGAKLSDLR